MSYDEEEFMSLVALWSALIGTGLWMLVTEPDPNYGKEVARAVVKCKLGFEPDYWGICKEIKPDAWDQLAAKLAENIRNLTPDYQIKAIEAWEDVKEWWNDLF